MSAHSKCLSDDQLAATLSIDLDNYFAHVQVNALTHSTSTTRARIPALTEATRTRNELKMALHIYH